MYKNKMYIVTQFIHLFKNIVYLHIKISTQAYDQYTGSQNQKGDESIHHVPVRTL